ncbi:HK97 family phage major capsid protein [Granulicella aggregans]|uniref:HK97 family phage major capsid protein n=2 Tax=Granulicella aggregans TaxID=474949 RepID=A0A7W7ZFU5_9BACT|nr:HK97 family phage major capsid protein [Granulicella aggregans]
MNRQFSNVGTSKKLSAQYANAFTSWLRGAGNPGTEMMAALNEGSNPAGGFAVPVIVDGQIVPLAPIDAGVRSLATVITTTSDMKVPFETTAATATAKPEASAFVAVSPAFGSFTLSAFMAGGQNDLTFEIFQDAKTLPGFVIGDMLRAQQNIEEPWFISGTGVGQPQGLLGNVGAGVTEEPDSAGNLVTINGASDLIGSLNSEYLPNAAFLMNRATATILRKAQTVGGVFYQAWTRENGVDYLHGFRVAYSASMPTAVRGATPILFGDFERGYLIGDRGSSDLAVKMLDQTKALQGLVSILTYRRTDGRVRRPDAIQSYTIAAS